MAQYKDGTVSTTAGSPTVTGVDTLWLSYVSVGDIIQIGGDAVFYEIGAVGSDTSLSLVSNYPSTLVTQSYVITTDFTVNQNLPLMNQGDLRAADIYSRAMKLIDAGLGLGLVYKGEVIDKDLNAAPASGVSDGDMYIVASGVSSGDDWFGYEDYLATWDSGDSIWTFELPVGGNYVFVVDEDALYFYTGNSWEIWTTLSAGANQAQDSFVDGDLAGGIFTFNHGLNNLYPDDPVVFDNSGVAWDVGWAVVDVDNVTLDMNPFGTLVGTYRVSQIG